MAAASALSGTATVITIDGPTASGKGTVASRVAEALQFHYLDSGALYRLVALRSMADGVNLDDPQATAQRAADLAPRFSGGRVYLDSRDVTEAIREEPVSRAASRVAVHRSVREALVDLQRNFRRAPGLVADGRDMGTAIFTDATLKVYLTATLERRAERRYKQLIENGFSSSITSLLQDLRERDSRDTQRAASPLLLADDARTLDTSELTITAAVDQILRWWWPLA